MVSKYFLRSLVLIMNLLLFSSCLNTTEEGEFEYSKNAQIYSISIASKADTLGLLSKTAFTIDQINGKLFNKTPLPYMFDVDSVTINISGATNINSFSDVTLKLTPDSSFSWTQNDSIPIKRLYQIVTTAPDGLTKKTYSFQLNIYEQNPYILQWENLTTQNYITPQIDKQRTIEFNDRFITYYASNGSINAKFSANDDGKIWIDANLLGIPTNIEFESISRLGNSLFVIDNTNRVYKSSDGFNWVEVQTDFPVAAIYGNLPSASKGGLLVMVNDNDELKFAETNDFTDLQIIEAKSTINENNFPVKDFSTVSIESSSSYSIKYIIIAGGTTINNEINKDVILLQEKDGVITGLRPNLPESININGGSLFYYDEKTYIIISSTDKNLLLFSENYGLSWSEVDDNQSFPTNFNNRINTSVITDDNNFIWIFGGVSSGQTQLIDVWKGRLNKFAMN